MSKYILPIIWLICFIAFNNKAMGYTHTSPLYTHITYIFAHAGLLHLAINAISYISLHNTIRKCASIKAALTISFISAIAATHLSTYDLPTIGASGLIFAMAGYLYASIKLKTRIIPYTTLAISLIVPFFIPQINAMIHLASFTTSLIITLIYKWYEGK